MKKIIISIVILICILIVGVVYFVSKSKTKKDNGDGKLILKQGDIISVTVKNSSTTLSQELKGFYYKITGSDLNIIVATETGVIAINGST